MMKKPVLFYFYAHSEPMELRTPTLRQLVERANVVYMERVTTNVQDVLQDARKWNLYIRGEGTIQVPTKHMHPYGAVVLHIANIMRGKNKYLFFEHCEIDWDFEYEIKNTRDAFFVDDLPTALRKRRDFLGKCVSLMTPREDAVLTDLQLLNDETLVVFGAGHTRLFDEVQKICPAEKYFPFQGYRLAYGTQEVKEYVKTKRLDADLYLRSVLETIVYLAFRAHVLPSQMPLDDEEQNAQAAKRFHYARLQYTSLFNAQEIVEYKEFLGEYALHHPIPLPTWPFIIGQRVDAFEAFCKKKGKPSIADVWEQHKP